MQAARTAGSPPGMPAAVADALRRGNLVLTANQRAARSLRLAFDAAQSRDRQPTWDAPRILSFQTWLADLWHQLLLDGAEDKLLLNRAQQHALWREIIAADPEVPSTRPLDALAELAARASNLLYLYIGSPDDGSPDSPEYNASTDTRAFARWARQFARICARELLLLPAELPAALQTACAAHPTLLPQAGLTLVDFDLHPPAHRALLDALRRNGVQIESIQTAAEPSAASLYTASDPRDELQSAAEWIRLHLQQDPATRIALVVPDLASRKPLIERLLSETLAGGGPSGIHPNPAPFECSLGQSLAQTGPVAVALDLLAWSLGPLPLDRIGPLLLSPFLAAPGELEAAARFDAFQLRAAPLLQPELSLHETLSLARASGPHPHHLFQRLRSMQTQAERANLVQSYAAHAEHFSFLLETAGWARAVPDDSLLVQIRRRWDGVLDELATLDFHLSGTASQPSASSALDTLHRLARQAIFAPQSRAAPVQVLGPLELGGVTFDALWFLSADDSAWPPRPSPHPLLPLRLQRRLGMPGSAPGASLQLNQDESLARALTRRIAHSASEVVFSYAQRDGDSLRQPSPLLRDLALPPSRFIPAPANAAVELYERVPDLTGLPSLPDAILRGGERVLKDQAACGFRAFAEHRLWSTALHTREPGLDPRDRGSLVHRILEIFWAEVHDQAALRALPPPQRDALLDRSIALALERPARHIRSAWDSAYLDLERERLRLLLRPWLELELERPPFRVQQQEQKLSDVSLGGLRLNLRVDRIDDTAAGPLILDYKTGPASPAEWLSDRPDAPQLPLYAVFNPAETLGGVAFALLRAGEDLCLKGFSDHSSAVLPGKPAKMPRTFAGQREDWQRILTDLATSFASGETRVDPKKYPGTCQYCAQRLLCRLDPAALNAPASTPEDEEWSAADV